jgi:hypothetical protein
VCNVCLLVQDNRATVVHAQCAQLAATLMGHAAFNELRTKQQLGYTVAATYTEHAGVRCCVFAEICDSQQTLVCVCALEQLQTAFTRGMLCLVQYWLAYSIRCVVQYWIVTFFACMQAHLALLFLWKAPNPRNSWQLASMRLCLTGLLRREARVLSGYSRLHNLPRSTTGCAVTPSMAICVAVPRVVSVVEQVSVIFHVRSACNY